MGLNESTRGNRTYVSIVQGQFAQKVTQDTPKAVKRVIEDKKTHAKREVWELLYGTVDGMIDSIEVDEGGNFGDQLKINMSDMDKTFTVTLSMAGREAKSFLCVLKNIDLNQPVILAPYNFESKEDGRQVIGMNTYQGADIRPMKSEERKKYKILPYFSKETPNGLPQVPEGSDKDEFKLVMKSQEIFLKKWVKKFIEEKFAGQPTPGKITPNTSAGSGDGKIYDNASQVDPGFSDLPFRFNPKTFKINF